MSFLSLLFDMTMGLWDYERKPRSLVVKNMKFNLENYKP